jgi:hypothetical protein
MMLEFKDVLLQHTVQNIKTTVSAFHLSSAFLKPDTTVGTNPLRQFAKTGIRNFYLSISTG